MAFSKSSASVRRLLEEEAQYSVGGTAPLPAFIVKAKGYLLWDVDGKEYIDFLCMFGAVNQGHSHPKIVTAVKEQLDRAALVNAAARNALWPGFARMMCERFGFDRITSTVSGTDAVDEACKISRKWAVTKKGIPAKELVILGVSGCFHGLGSGVWGLQDRSAKYSAYGLDDKQLQNSDPSTGAALEYGDLGVMRRCLEINHGRVAAVILECIRCYLPTFEEEIRYAQGVYDLCRKYHVLFIADEIRMGICKTGRMLGCDYLGETRQPDLVTLGKSITGGVYPASYVLGKKEVMDVVGSHEILSTYGFSPLAVVATIAALKVSDEEELSRRAIRLQELFTNHASQFGWHDYPLVDYITARGGEFRIYLKPQVPGLSVAIGMSCMSKGLLLFPKETYLRMSSTLIISEGAFSKALCILGEALKECLGHGIPDCSEPSSLPKARL